MSRPMTERAPLYLYLKDVLGIEAFLLPEGAPSPTLVGGEAELKRPRILVPRELTSTENAFLKKMLASIALENYQVVATAEVQNLVLESPFARPQEILGFFEMVSPQTDPSEVTRLKKAAWAILQQFKQGMEA